MDGGRSGMVAALQAALDGSDSTTATLERWCDAYGLAGPGRLVAQRLPGPARPPGRLRRRRLRLGAHERLRYRRVLLRLGTLVLCEAENWYVPERLPVWMSRLLDRSTVPFGRVVAPLGFRRHRLSMQVFHAPATGRDIGLGRQPILRQKAVLTLPGGRPFCEVVETFTSALLAPAAVWNTAGKGSIANITVDEAFARQVAATIRERNRWSEAAAPHCPRGAWRW